MPERLRVGILIGKEYMRDRKLLRRENPFFLDFPSFLKRKGVSVSYFSPDRLPDDLPLFVYKAFNKYFSPEELRFMPAFYDLVKMKRTFLINSLAFLRATGDKKVLHSILAEDEKIQKYLPRTIALSDVKTADELKKNFGSYLIKPAKGSDGVDIHRVGKLNRSQCGFYLNKAAKYILQETVDCPLVKGRVFDVRIGMIKKKSRFSVFYEYARVGAKGDFRSNISQGGRVVYPDRFGELVKPVMMREMRNVALSIAETVVNGTGYANICCADFMVNREGRIFFIEANSAPGWHFLYGQDRASRLALFAELFVMLKQFLFKIKSGKDSEKGV